MTSEVVTNFHESASSHPSPGRGETGATHSNSHRAVDQTGLKVVPEGREAGRKRRAHGCWWRGIDAVTGVDGALESPRLYTRRAAAPLHPPSLLVPEARRS